MQFYRNHGKRALDVVAASLGLLALSVPLGLVACLVRWKLGRPVLFRQERPGLYAKSFRLVKFRTMTDEKDADGHLLPDSVRLTQFGRFLRKTSLDEFPELWNVLKGDMSLVGPRPLLKEYLPFYTEREATRHDVRPGITGLAQVSGRNGLRWDERLELDAQYVERLTFGRDMAILWRTFLSVLKRSGVSSDTALIEPNFAAERSALETHERNSK